MKAFALLCCLAAAFVITSGQTTYTEEFSSTDEDTSTAEISAPFSVPLISEDQKTEESTSPTEKDASEPVTPVSRTTAIYRLKDSNGHTCILLQVDGLVIVEYRTRSKEIREKDQFIPDDAETTGNCNNDNTAELRLSWDPFEIVWIFSKSPGGERWFVEKMDLNFKTKNDVFENVETPDRMVRLSTSHKHSSMLFPTPVGQSYSCETEETTVELSNREGQAAKILLRDFRLQPFIFKNEDFGPEFDCTGGASFRDETAPIAVGSTLAIVVLLTVTGYAIYRYFKIKKVQYDTME